MSSAHGHLFTFCFSGPVLMENRHACNGSAARTDHQPGEGTPRRPCGAPGPMGIRPPDGGADKGYTAGTSSDVSVSTGFAFTSPESAAGALPVGAACSGGTRVIA